MNDKRLEDAVKKAVETEEHGHRFYKAQAEASTNALAKALLEELAEDEMRHCLLFREFGRRVTGEQDPVADTECVLLEDRLKAAFEEMDATARARGDKSQEEVLKEAVRLEKESYATYDELFKTSFGSQKEFFDRMRREEYDHLVALENTLMYLSNTGMWFDIEESRRWNWMNI